ncbi:hypothetical protein PCLA_07f0155 [Pseudomonas citronellolis]|nr:hypothetical protein PCLA_07f0155 [Pseudomonas citronellolis]
MTGAAIIACVNTYSHDCRNSENQRLEGHCRFHGVSPCI